MNPKLEVFDRMLAEGPIHCTYDPRVAGVIIPPAARSHLPWWAALHFSNHFRNGPPTVGEDGVMATLSFNGQPFECYVPWTAVYILQPADLDGKGPHQGEIHIFAGSAPPEWLASLPPEARESFERAKFNAAAKLEGVVVEETPEETLRAPPPVDLPSNVVPFRRKT